jgi:cytochrome P450
MTAQVLEFVNPLNTTDQKLLNNPYPLLKKLREESPVYWSNKDKYWLISRHAEVTAILKDPSFEKQIQTWKHAPNPILVSLIPHVRSISNVAKNWLLNLNPPAHTRVRALLNKAFTGHAIEQLKPTIESLATGLLEGASTNSDFELMKQFAIPLPVAVIGHMLGVPSEHGEEMKHWSTRLAGAAGRQKDLKALAEAGKAVEQLTLFFRPMIEKRRLNPTDDLLSVLVQAEIEGSQLKTDELIANCILLMIGGHETTTNLIGSAVVLLLKNPEQFGKLRAQPAELMTSTIAEVLRFESPAQTVPRIATRDIEMAGKKIKAGDMCWLLLGSANRDPAVFENPDSFDITRTPSNQMVSFGGGIHRCIGASLAEVELSIAMNALLNWRESYTLKSNPVNFKTPFTIRGIEEVLLSV